MDEPYLTMAEIEAKYPNEWVLIDRKKLDRYHQTVAGRVLFHSPDADEVYRRAEGVPPPRSLAVLYMGPPDDVEFAL